MLSTTQPANLTAPAREAMHRIKPIPYKHRKFTLGQFNRVEVYTEPLLKAEGNVKQTYSSIKNYKYINVELSETNHQHLLHHISRFKYSRYRKVISLSIVFNYVWSDRLKIFMALAHYMKKLSLIRKFSITIDFCLDTLVLDYLLFRMRSLKHLKHLKVDLSKFYRITVPFIKSLSKVITSFHSLQALELNLAKTPEISFNDDLATIFLALNRLRSLETLNFKYWESIQIKKYNQPVAPARILSYLETLNLKNFSLSIKSNSLSDQLVSEIIKVITANRHLEKLNLELMDVDNLLNANNANFAIENLMKNRSVHRISLDNTLQEATSQQIESLFFSVSRFISTHLSIEELDMRIAIPSYSQGMKLAFLLTSLKRLKSLSLTLTASMGLIILQNLSHLTYLEQLSISLEFELDVQISGLLESIGNLHKLKVLKLVNKKRTSSMSLQKEDFQSLFISLKKLKDLRSVEVLLPLQEGTNQSLGSRELCLMKEFLMGASLLEVCRFKIRWDLITGDDAYSLLEALFQRPWIDEYYEFFFGLRNSNSVNFSTLLKSLLVKYRHTLDERRKRGPLYKLIIHAG